MLRPLPPLIEPDEWTLAFHRTTPFRWLRVLAIGKYKHVSAFAFVPAYRMWVYYGVTVFGTRIVLLPDGDGATRWLTAETADADLVSIRRRPRRQGRPPICLLTCVSAVKHLIGLRCGALLPSTLYDHVLANGGEIIHGRRRSEADDHTGAIGAAAAGGS